MSKPTGRQQSAKPVNRSMDSVRARQTPEPSQSAAGCRPAVPAHLDTTGCRVEGDYCVNVSPHDTPRHAINPCDLPHHPRHIAHKDQHRKSGQHTHEIAGCYLL